MVSPFGYAQRARWVWRSHEAALAHEAVDAAELGEPGEQPCTVGRLEHLREQGHAVVPSAVLAHSSARRRAMSGFAFAEESLGERGIGHLLGSFPGGCHR